MGVTCMLQKFLIELKEFILLNTHIFMVHLRNNSILEKAEFYQGRWNELNIIWLFAFVLENFKSKTL